jgi:hypothetical protein
LEDDVPAISNTKEFYEEQDKKEDVVARSEIKLFSPTEEALQAWRHHGTKPSHDLESICTEPTVDINDSLDCTNEDDVILFSFSELFAFVSDLESELDTSMEEVVRLNLDYCPSVANAPTIPMPSLLDTKNQSNMAIPLECHLTLYETVDCIVDRLPLKDLLIVGQSDKKATAMMHGDEGIGVHGLKELDPGPSKHDGICICDIMEQARSHIHYELVDELSYFITTTRVEH